ncbi:RidA family protein, partial [Paenibacillus tundrae]
FTTEQGYEFARNAAIEVLAVVQEVLGSLDRVKRVVKVQGFINATASYEEHHKVLNGFSDLMLDVFGEQGVHARSVFGAVSVRDNLPLIIDSIFQVEE